MALATAPVSNSAGHTRLPTFSRMTRSSWSMGTLSRPWRVISASRWHMPPVCSWMDAMPVASLILMASTSESISASITAMRSLSLSRPMVWMRVVVLPLPGEDMRFRRNTPWALSSFLRRAASSSLLAKMLFLISITFTGSMRDDMVSLVLVYKITSFSLYLQKEKRRIVP